MKKIVVWPLWALLALVLLSLVTLPVSLQAQLVGSAIILGAIAVANGHALDCRRYSGGRYRDLETPAARSRIGRAPYC